MLLKLLKLFEKFYILFSQSVLFDVTMVTVRANKIRR